MEKQLLIAAKPKKNFARNIFWADVSNIFTTAYLGRYLLSLFIRSFFSYADRENYFRIAGPDYTIILFRNSKCVMKWIVLLGGFIICHLHLLFFCVYKQKRISTNEAFVHFSKQLPDEFLSFGQLVFLYLLEKMFNLILFYILSCKYQNCMRA